MHYFCLDIEIDPNKDYVEKDYVKIKIIPKLGEAIWVDSILNKIEKEDSFAKLYFVYTDPNDPNLLAKSIFRMQFIEPSIPNYS